MGKEITRHGPGFGRTNGCRSSTRRACGGLIRAVPILFGLVALTDSSWGYSLLTHEEIVDISWKDDLVPLLLKRYPAATEKQLHEAHAHAYGGCLLQDIGYYPFGNKFFSDLTHYVRSGDFVANLIRESEDLDEYAFALGALSHYSSDSMGHPPVNLAVALTFPKLRSKYGDSVTYEQNPKAHIQTEFGFDITQVAKRRFTSDRYHDFIGFQVSKPLLERAFLRTYGLRLEAVMGGTDLAIGTYRRAVSQVIPEMTRAALTTYHPELVREVPNFSERQFLYNLSRVQYETEWGREYRKPGFVARVLGWFVKLVPKVGILGGLAFKIPTQHTEDLYIQSVNRTVEDYRLRLRQVGQGNLHFPNMDCDTGRPTTPGEYTLCDATYARLLDELLKRKPPEVPPALRADILAFYADPAKVKTRKHRRARQRLALELKALQSGANSTLAFEIRQRLEEPPFKLQSPKAAGA
jgi:hypothetical protein